VLISLLFANLIAFSQTDTSTSVKSFPIPIVRLIMKDLLSGDSAKAQLKLVEKEVVELNSKIVLKDSVINTLRLKEDNYMTIINSEKEKYKIVESYSKKLEWDLKKEKTKNKFKSFVGTAVIGVLAFFIIQK
jgi:hypothetical protein